MRSADLPALLADDLASDRIFGVESATKPSYWFRDARTEARERLLTITAHATLTTKDLTTRASSGTPKLPQALVKSVAEELFSRTVLGPGYGQRGNAEMLVGMDLNRQLRLQTSVPPALTYWRPHPDDGGALPSLRRQPVH